MDVVGVINVWFVVEGVNMLMIEVVFVVLYEWGICVVLDFIVNVGGVVVVVFFMDICYLLFVI